MALWAGVYKRPSDPAVAKPSTGISQGLLGFRRLWLAQGRTFVAIALVRGLVWNYYVGAVAAQEPASVCPRRHDSEVVTFHAVRASDDFMHVRLLRRSCGQQLMTSQKNYIVPFHLLGES